VKLIAHLSLVPRLSTIGTVSPLLPSCLHGVPVVLDVLFVRTSPYLKFRLSFYTQYVTYSVCSK